jgi:signal transduction histidine kinase
LILSFPFNVRRGHNARVALAFCSLLALGLVTALLIAELTMSPPQDELLSLAGYLALTGAAAILFQWVLLNWGPVSRHLGLRNKAFAGSAIGGLLGLLNVLIIAQQMFISTAHDLWVLAASIAFSVAVMTSFSLFVATSVASRVEAIRQAVRSLASEPTGTAMSEERDEIDRLQDEIDHLAERLQAAELERQHVEEERKLLTASVSHDLRTPVASIQAIAEALASGVLRTEEERESYVKLLQKEIERIGRMIEDLFDLAQLDTGALRLDRRDLPLEDIVGDVVEGMRPQARQRRLDVKFRAGQGLRNVSIDGGLMARAVANLVRNSIEHTPAGGEIVLDLRREGSWLRLTVSDTGNGFEEAESQRIWERFYRADKARSRNASGDGAGLGLAIVKGFTEAHGGRVEAASSPGAGATFRLWLPLAEAPAERSMVEGDAAGG